MLKVRHFWNFIRKLKKRERIYGNNFKLELVKINSTRIKIFSVILVIIFVVYLLFIDFPNFMGGRWRTSNGYIWIALGRVFVTIFAVIGFTGSFFVVPNSKKFKLGQTIFFQRLIITLSLFSLIINTTGEYIVFRSVQTYIGSILAFSIIVLLPDGFAFLLYFGSFVLMSVLTILHTSSQLLETPTLTDIFTFSLLSYIFSRIVYYMQLNNYYYRTIIIAQRNKMRDLASFDQLTGVFNRRKFEEILSSEINRANRYKHIFSIVMFDIDHFKKVNDRYGHQYGDMVLKGMCHLVESNLRTTDTLIRWGGEEFVIIASETTYPDTISLAEKLRTLMSKHTFPEVGQITMSFGLAEYMYNETGDSLLHRADSALYRAKKNGRNRVEYSVN